MTTITGPADTFAATLAACLVHVDKERANLYNVLIEPGDGETMTATATDGYSLAHITMPGTCSAPILVGADTVKEMVRTLKGWAKLHKNGDPVARVTFSRTESGSHVYDIGWRGQVSTATGTIDEVGSYCRYRHILDALPDPELPARFGAAILARVTDTATKIHKDAHVTIDVVNTRKPFFATVCYGTVSGTVMVMPVRV